MIAASQSAPAEGERFLPGSTRPIDIAKALIERKADVNAKSSTGMTALMIAAAHNNPPMIGLLIEFGADPDAKNNQGQTAERRRGDQRQSRKPRRRSRCSPRRKPRAPRRHPLANPRARASNARAARASAETCGSHGDSRGFLLCAPFARPRQGFHRDRREAGGRSGDCRAVEGRRLRVPRSQARRRPQSRLRADQDRARHGRLWLVRQCHLPRQGRAEEAIRHRLLVQAGGRPASRSWTSGCRRGRSRRATAGSWSRACPWPGGGSRCRSIPATWRSPAPGR